jgi:zinc transport system substrate-binding protein
MRRWFAPTALVFGIVLLMILSQPGCGTVPNYWKDAKKGQKHVLASFPPLYSMAHAVAGDDAYVLCLEAKKGPHEYTPVATEMRKVRDADLILANGLQLDDRIMDRLLAGASVPASRLVKVGDALPKEMLKEGKLHHGHKHGDYDPHVWLGPPQAIAMIRTIAANLAQVDPKNKAGYETRAEAFIKQLEDLAAHGRQLLKDKKNKRILSQHESLVYFAEAFRLEVVDSIQQMPGADADAAHLGALARECRDNKIQVIAVEPQYPKAQAEALQKQLKHHGLDVHLVEVDPIETAPVAPGNSNPDPGYYLAKMRQNIENLAKALP